MAISQSEIGELTLRFLDHTKDEYGEEATLVRSMIIAEIRYPDPDGETTHHTVIWDTTEPSPVAKHGLAAFVAKALAP